MKGAQAAITGEIGAELFVAMQDSPDAGLAEYERYSAARRSAEREQGLPSGMTG